MAFLGLLRNSSASRTWHCAQTSATELTPGGAVPWLPWQVLQVGADVSPRLSSAAACTLAFHSSGGLPSWPKADMGAGQEVPESEHIDRGVNCELTDIGVNGVSYYSLAFEAFPDDPEMPEQFSKLVSNFLTAFDPAAFAGIQSLSYPAWLDQIAQASHV